jgi:hypothetical protein
VTTEPVDFYKQCENFVRALLKAKMPNHFVNEWQLTDNEYDVKRGGIFFVVFRPGAIPLPFDSERDGEKIEMHWLITLNVFARYVEKKTQWSDFTTYRGLIWHHLMNPRNSLEAPNNIWRVLSVTAPEDPVYWSLNAPINKADESFMFQPLTATVKQTVVFE